jgi:hypothetical protein
MDIANIREKRYICCDASKNHKYDDHCQFKPVKNVYIKPIESDEDAYDEYDSFCCDYHNIDSNGEEVDE